MLDNLSGQDSTPLFNNEDNEDNEDINENTDLGLKKNIQRKSIGKILGLKPFQLFILLLMLLLVVCLLGTMFLLVTGKIVPSFL